MAGNFPFRSRASSLIKSFSYALPLVTTIIKRYDNKQRNNQKEDNNIIKL